MEMASTKNIFHLYFGSVKANRTNLKKIKQKTASEPIKVTFQLKISIRNYFEQKKRKAYRI